MIKRIMVLLGIALLGASQAHASTIPTLVSIVPDLANPGQFTWTYNLSLSTDASVVGGGAVPGASTPAGPGILSGTVSDYFTVFDFVGYTGIHSEPVGWSFQSLLLGSTPADVLPADDGTLPDLTWYRAGGTIVGPQASLGTFSANSVFNQLTIDNFVSQDTRSSGVSAGTELSSIGTAEVPKGTAVPQGTAVPEPGSLILLASGLLATLGVWRNAKRS